MAEREVTDPHPSNEDHYDEQRRPGGANPPRDDIGPNDAVHDGKQHPLSEISDKSGYRK